MKVIFLQDVPNVAQAGEVKEVADGYGRNFLIPKKLAALANPQAISQAETRAQKMEARLTAELEELASQLEGKEVSLKAKAGAKDRLYGSITSADIAAELNNITGLDIDKRKIELDEPIRQLGSYEIAIRLARDIVPKIKVTVTEEEAPKEKEKPPEKKKKAAKGEKKTQKKEEKVQKKVEKPEKEEERTRKKTPKKEEKAPKKKKRTTKKEEKT
jgi:large subunit ribosomal protein L9